MEVKCEYCGSMIDDHVDKCPNCGSTNENMKRMVDKSPKTIAELQEWYKARNLPPYETTRFFIGIDTKEKRAFGIYKDAGEFVVYKNKDDGTRAVRYRGKDEAYAVNEIWMKLKTEIIQQKAINNARHSQGKGENQNNRNNKGGSRTPASKPKPMDTVKEVGETGWGCTKTCFFYLMAFFGFAGAIITIGEKPLELLAIVGIPILIWILITRFSFAKSKGFQRIKKIVFPLYLIYAVCGIMWLSGDILESTTPKYYQYEDSVYVYYDDDYYYYDTDTSDYTYVSTDSIPPTLLNNSADYVYDTTGTDWDSMYTFEDSSYYEENLAPWYETSGSDDYSSSWSSSDDDYDYSWDSDSSWDSGSSDWGSDW